MYRATKKNKQSSDTIWPLYTLSPSRTQFKCITKSVIIIYKFFSRLCSQECVVVISKLRISQRILMYILPHSHLLQFFALLKLFFLSLFFLLLSVAFFISIFSCNLFCLLWHNAFYLTMPPKTSANINNNTITNYNRLRLFFFLFFFCLNNNKLQKYFHRL